MNATGSTEVPGLGTLTYQGAIDIARNAEGNLNPAVRNYLEAALAGIWSRISIESDTYILNQNEFAVFNFFIARFKSPDNMVVAEKAIARHWLYAGRQETTRVFEQNAYIE